MATHNFFVPGGWAGVDLFFVLSGFLITRILLNTRSLPGYRQKFYARRFLRIFPVYYLTLGLVWLFYSNAEGKIWWYAAYLPDFGWLARDKDLDLLGHTWSLAIEEQFYLVFPLLVWLILVRLKWSRGALAGVLGAGLRRRERGSGGCSRWSRGCRPRQTKPCRRYYRTQLYRPRSMEW
jgi:peptidoglycan/LPS O-acetylase OafA/YrhL